MEDNGNEVSRPAARGARRSFGVLASRVAGRAADINRGTLPAQRSNRVGGGVVAKAQPFPGQWREAVCIASGPSLTEADVEQVRAWREAKEGRHVVVVNTTFRIAPWADALYALDRKWWDNYGAEVNSIFTGDRASFNPQSSRWRVTHLPAVKSYRNSGAGAVNFSAWRGAKRIVLLGYDCQRSGGKAHWHPDHPVGMGNAGSINRWHEDFGKLAKILSGVEVINATRETALKCWPRETLEKALAHTDA